jgi:hypothetical protein
MTDRSDAAGSPAAVAIDTYSPQRRTALLLAGTGTAGAYHAGVLRALHEAGVKIDIVAGRGIGAVGALFAAVDGVQRLWDDKGFWKAPDVEALYAWRTLPRIVVSALALSVAIVALPVAAVAVGLVVFPIDFMLKMVGAGAAGGRVAAYLRFADAAFASDALPTWLPRLVLLVLATAATFAVVDGWLHGPSRGRGAVWWRAVRAPLSSSDVIDRCWRMMWDLVRGAAALQQPPPAELGRRYVELLAENLGQPGFRELLIAVHDTDAHRDLIFALVADARRRDLVRRPTTDAAEARRAEVFDLAGLARDHLPDAIAAALTVPLATEWHTVTFASDAYWRGESHRLGDRPAGLVRIIDELIDLGAEQIVLASAAPETPGPHALAAPRLDFRGRLGEYLSAAEAAVLRDATTTTGGVRIFTIRPAHNPVGPFDFGGGWDDGSRRRIGLAELMNRGYEDAYHQFVEPVVGASGERLLKSQVSSLRSQV